MPSNTQRTKRLTRWLRRDKSAGRVALLEDRAEALRAELRQAEADYNEVSESLRDQNEKWKRACAERDHYKSALVQVADGPSEPMGQVAIEALSAWRRA